MEANKKEGRLALTIPENTSVQIGETILVRIVQARRGRAKILVTAPKDLLISRPEHLRGVPDASKR